MRACARVFQTILDKVVPGLLCTHVACLAVLSALLLRNVDLVLPTCQVHWGAGRERKRGRAEGVMGTGDSDGKLRARGMRAAGLGEGLGWTRLEPCLRVRGRVGGLAPGQ